MQKIRVFVGSEPKTEIARKVLEYSILKNAKKPENIEFHTLMGDSWVADPKLGVGTGFSLLRWDIPKRCNYEGFAIYLDADQLVFDDISDLWQSDIHYPNKSCSVWCTYQASKWFKHKTPETSVMVMDCEKAKFNQKNLAEICDYLKGDKDRSRYIAIMRAMEHTNAPQIIPNSWNHLNTFILGKTKLLHYTKEPKQPWFSPDHTHRDLWEEQLKNCINDGVISKEEIQDAIASFVPHKKGQRGTGLNPYYAKYVI